MSNKSTGSAHWGHSLRELSWDKSEDRTLSQEMISSTVHEWYDAKHRMASAEEIELINSTRIDECPYCGSADFKKNGHYSSGIIRYYCHDCKRSFNVLTNTIFADKKIPISEWIEYLIHLFEFHSINSSSRDNRNAASTGRYWLYKVFEVLKHYQDDIVLEGKIWLDETFFSVKKSDIRYKTDGLQYKGISRNKISVVCAINESGKVVLICEYTSKPSSRSTWKAIGSHIREGSHLIHDGERSHSILINELNLTSEVYDSQVIAKFKDKDNPLDSINEIHALAKRFMRAHGGYDRDNLQDFMNLIAFILNRPDDRYEKVDQFINMALLSPIRVKYRDVMSNSANK